MIIPKSGNVRSWDVLLIGGASGTGKTSVSYRLAQRSEVGIMEVDDLQIGLRRMTTPKQQPILHYWHTHPEASAFSADKILELHIAVGRVMLPMLEAVVENHLDSGAPVVLEGDYILPELVIQAGVAEAHASKRILGIFLYEPEEAQIVRNFALREPEAGDQTKRARVSWLYGEWLREECSRYGLTALAARPWDTLLTRIEAALASK